MPKNEDDMLRINISIPKSLLEEFDELCEAQFRPRSTQIAYMMKKALQQYKSREGLDIDYPLISRK